MPSSLAPSFPHIFSMANGQSSTSNPRFVSPSELDGISSCAEILQLTWAADLICECSAALRLSLPARLTAQMLLQRFYTCVSLRSHCTIWAAGAVLLLSAKLHGKPRNIRHVANVLYDRLHAREGDAETVIWNGETRRRPLDFYGAAGYDWKHELILTERHVLKELGFQLHAEMPHQFLLVFANTLRDKSKAPEWTAGAKKFQDLLQGAWNCANDVMRLRVCVAEKPDRIASACIAMSLKRMGGSLPEGWHRVFGSSTEDVARICGEMERGYEKREMSGRFLDYSFSDVFKEYHGREENSAQTVSRRVGLAASDNGEKELEGENITPSGKRQNVEEPIGEDAGNRFSSQDLQRNEREHESSTTNVRPKKKTRVASGNNVESIDSG